MSQVKQCYVCGILYNDYQLEEIFTGRKRLICQKCINKGQKLTGELLSAHYTRFANNGGKKK